MLGTCNEMCPFDECILRTETNRLSVFEKHSGKCVKEYVRCAAGTSRSPKGLRTKDALYKTTDFLSKKHLLVFTY